MGITKINEKMYVALPVALIVGGLVSAVVGAWTAAGVLHSIQADIRNIAREQVTEHQFSKWLLAEAENNKTVIWHPLPDKPVESPVSFYRDVLISSRRD